MRKSTSNKKCSRNNQADDDEEEAPRRPSFNHPYTPAYNYQSIPSADPTMAEKSKGTKNKPNKDANNDDNGESKEGPSNAVAELNLQPPSYQKLERPIDAADSHAAEPNNGCPRNKPANDYYVKTCRICLEEDSPETMIAPCKCKGGSKWVHGDCLDEWRLHEKDRAFSKCTECLFDFYLQPVYEHEESEIQRRRKCLFYSRVSRDFLLAAILLQIIIVAMAAFVWICDVDRELPNQFLPAFKAHPVSLYYLLGWAMLLVLTGLYGSCVLCFHQCSISRSIQAIHPPSPATTTRSGVTMEDEVARGIGVESNAEFYRRARYRRRQRYTNRNQDHYRGDCCYYCDCYPLYVYNPGYYHHHHSSGSNGDSGCCCGGASIGSGGGGGGSGGNDCGDSIHILLLILLIIAIILAIIGFFVGIVITVIASQRVVQRHIHLLQKRQLIREYKVIDLQDYDLDQPLPTAPTRDDLEAQEQTTTTLTPTAPMEPLPENDVVYLQKLGLIDRDHQ
mmetsp:Transcript_14042/g.22595  ORF Transcript_14042/g.22595 Transcript_14042/m.22595 type:complete len:506 (-) Transcript_14042:94-1611(-)